MADHPLLETLRIFARALDSAEDRARTLQEELGVARAQAVEAGQRAQAGDELLRAIEVSRGPAGDPMPLALREAVYQHLRGAA